MSTPKEEISPRLAGNHRDGAPQNSRFPFRNSSPLFRRSHEALRRTGAGRLRAVKVGKRTLILITDAERWLATLAGPGEVA